MRLCIICLAVLSFCLSPLDSFGQDNRWHRNSGVICYTPSGFPLEKTIPVHYYIPTTGDIRRMRVLFAFHGAERNASFTLNMWKSFAEKERFIVIAPEFSRSGYPENDYQLGAVYRTNRFRALNTPGHWTYVAVEELFDLFRQETGNQSKLYDVWGHSAGGQFVHRFLLAVPDARIGLAVASNPGFWTFPVVEGIKDVSGKIYGWPYSVKETPFGSGETVRRFLARRLIVHLGDADLNNTGKYVPTSPGALAQGENRFERGLKFFCDSESLARRMRVPFNWTLIIVPGIGHSGHGMVYGKMSLENGVQLFSTERRDSTGAYELIYGGGIKADR